MSNSQKSKKKFTKSPSKKYLFILRDINPENIENRFGITLTSNINIIDESPNNTTKISDLSTNKTTPEVISFIDEAKKHHKCNISMIDFKSQKHILSDNEFQYQCFWCRHNIPSSVIAIGCPIKYVPNKAIKTYYSEISKDTYTIKENITQKTLDKIKECDDRLVTEDKGYYITDGIFCSFNCCMAYITENSYNSMYNMSEMLLLKMYNNIYPDEIPSIEEAPHWRLLKQSGGHLSIDQFRDSFSKITYQPYGTVNFQIDCRSLGNIYEEKLRF